MTAPRTVHLHGKARAVFAVQFPEHADGKVSLAVRSPAECFIALSRLCPPMAKVIRDSHWHITTTHAGQPILADQLSFGLSPAEDLHLRPVLEGGSDVFNFVGDVLSGVFSALDSLFPTDDESDDRDTQNPRSKLFNGAVNSTAEGGVVPVVYGQVRVGSIVASAGIHSHRVSPDE